MNILFKRDYSNNIGLGHLHRSNTLAEVFKKKKHKCYFLGLKPGIPKKNKISELSELKDEIFTKNFIKKNKINIVIKDSYSLGLNWEKNISKRVHLVVIGDHNNLPHYCNLYINYHFYWFKKNKFKFLKNKKCKKLIGPKYTIIKDFNSKTKIKLKYKTILIYMGGADKNLYMFKFIKIFSNKDFNNYQKIFILNDNHLKNKNLLKDLDKIKNTKVFKNKIKNFHQYLKSSDLCILAAGQTMIERLAFKKKCLIVAQNNIQKKILNSLSKKKLIMPITNFKKINLKLINNFLYKKKPKKTFVNKFGKFLIYNKIVSQYKNNQ